MAGSIFDLSILLETQQTLDYQQPDMDVKLVCVLGTADSETSSSEPRCVRQQTGTETVLLSKRLLDDAELDDQSERQLGTRVYQADLVLDCNLRGTKPIAECLQSKLKFALQGGKLCVVSFGESASGQADYMLSSSEQRAEDAGIVPSVLSKMITTATAFTAQAARYQQQIASRQQQQQPSRPLLYRVRVSVLQVDGEAVTDVLNRGEETNSCYGRERTVVLTDNADLVLMDESDHVNVVGVRLSELLALLTAVAAEQSRAEHAGGTQRCLRSVRSAVASLQFHCSLGRYRAVRARASPTANFLVTACLEQIDVSVGSPKNSPSKSPAAGKPGSEAKRALERVRVVSRVQLCELAPSETAHSHSPPERKSLSKSAENVNTTPIQLTVARELADHKARQTALAVQVGVFLACFANDH